MLPSTPPFLELGSAALPIALSGQLRGYRHSRPDQRLWRGLHHKRWFYVTANNANVQVAAAFVDLGYARKVFCYVFERGSSRLTSISRLLPPGPWFSLQRHPDGSGAATAKAPGLQMAMSLSVSGLISLSVTSKAFHFSLSFAREAEEDDEPLVAATFLPGGASNLTEKTFARRVSGWVHLAEKTLDFSDAWGGMDFTDGYLPRETRWQWAFIVARTAQGRIGLNLLQGFNGACECVVADSRGLHPLGEGRFVFDPKRPLDPWQVQTTDNAVALKFQPLALHAEASNLGIARSRYVQPVGLFSGVISTPGARYEIDNLLGVVEDQDVLW